jgi:hypothetical protein
VVMEDVEEVERDDGDTDCEMMNEYCDSEHQIIRDVRGTW